MVDIILNASFQNKHSWEYREIRLIVYRKQLIENMYLYR